MKIKNLVWLPEIIEKLETRHQVNVHEVVEIFQGRLLYRRGPRGQRSNEDLYKAYTNERLSYQHFL